MEVQGDGECCAVCIEPYKISDVLRVLPCKHDFHKSCIDPWLLEHRTCPMCKMDILHYYGFVFQGSQESILQLDIEDGEGRANGAVSPLPRQPSRSSSYEVAYSERSSRASSPDEMTPSLPSSTIPAGGYSKLPPPAGPGDSPSFDKRNIPSVHTTASCSRQPLDTTVTSDECSRDGEPKADV